MHGDPAVAALAAQLGALLAGELPPDASVVALFQTQLDDSEAVATGLTRLRTEQSGLRSTIERIEAQVAQAERSLPKPEAPALLGQELVQPTAPVAPQCSLQDSDPLPPHLAPPAGPAPSPPAPLELQEPSPPTPPAPLTRAQRGSRRARAAHRRATRQYEAAQRAHPEALEQHKAAVAAHEQALGEYRAALTAHEAERRTYDERLASHEEALRSWVAAEAKCVAARAEHTRQVAAYEQAVVAWTAQVAEVERTRQAHQQATEQWRGRVRELRRQLREDSLRARQRQTVAARRQQYLELLAASLAGMPDPARGALRSLPQPRTALRKREAQLLELGAALKRYQRRLRRLARRCAAGGLVGFLVDRQELQQHIEQGLASVLDRRKRLRFASEEILHLAAHQEHEGAGLRRQVLGALGAPDRAARLDRLFLDRLKEVRRLRQLAAHGQLPNVGSVDADALRQEVDRLLPTPDALDTVAAGEVAQTECTEAVARIDALLDGLNALRDHWQLAYEREALTLLEALATEATRRKAFSLSAEMLQDLRAEGQEVVRGIDAWAQRRWTDLRAAPKRLGDAGGWRTVLGLLAIPALVGLLFLLRSFWGRGVHRIVRALARVRWLRGRAGALVRGANLVEAPLPVLAAWGGGEAVLWLLGADAPEVFIAGVVFRRVIAYLLGRRVLLGLTRRISPRRPAVIDAKPDTVVLLERTYARCGVVLVVASILSALARRWLGSGMLPALVTGLTWTWLIAVWGGWAATVWRQRLSDAWLGLAAPRLGPGDRLARLAGRHWLATPLVPLLLLVLVAATLRRWSLRLLSEGGVLGYLRARQLGRLARHAAEQSVSAQARLPPAYLEEFPLYPLVEEDQAVILPRAKELKVVTDSISEWDLSGDDGALLVLGDKGVGKTTLMALVARSVPDRPVRRLCLQRRVTDEAGLVADLAPDLGLPNCSSVEELATHLQQQPRQVLLLDEAHNVFLRSVGGYDAFELLVRLVQLSSERVFWVLVFNRYSWVFLKHSQRSAHYFRRQLQLTPWSAAELRDLIVRRNERAGLQIEFEEMLLEGGGGGDGPEVVETAEGYFRLLQQASEGNPRIATALWLESLSPTKEGGLRVGLFRAEDTDELERLDSELVFALAALVHHENLSVSELHRALNVPVEHAEFYLRLLAQQGLVERKHTDPTRHTLAPRTYLQVLALLRSRHLMFE